MAEEKLRKRSGFEIYSYFKDSTLPQQLKAVQGSKLGMWVQSRESSFKMTRGGGG